MNVACCINEWAKLLAPSVSTVILGGLLLQRFFVRRANQAVFIDHLIKELMELRDSSLEYWSTTKTEDNRNSLQLLEARIKGRVQGLLADLDYFRKYQPSCCSRLFQWLCRIDKAESPEYLQAMLDVYDYCTGGDFETENHQAKSEIHLSICSSISRVKSDLLRKKL